jgi:hypothetical protein
MAESQGGLDSSNAPWPRVLHSVKFNILLLHLRPVNPQCKAAKKLAIYSQKERFKIEKAKIN